jgi:hypothetical protein
VAAPEALCVRRAALLLHGLPEQARGRVLAKLSAGEAARLRPLLRELTELGVSPALSRELQETAIAMAPPPRAASARKRVESLGAADVTTALEACAPVTIAALLRISEWSWKPQFLEACGELRRAELRRHLQDDAPAVSPAVAEALCARLCQETGAPWTR